MMFMMFINRHFIMTLEEVEDVIRNCLIDG